MPKMEVDRDAKKSQKYLGSNYKRHCGSLRAIRTRFWPASSKSNRQRKKHSQVVNKQAKSETKNLYRITFIDNLVQTSLQPISNSGMSTGSNAMVAITFS
jgi:hypothetical protein